MIYQIVPVSKPRQTQSDKWKKRECVLRYRAFADECRLKIKSLPDRFHVTFYLPMPPSWSIKKKMSMEGRAHQQKPDGDNLQKALQDALRDDDSSIWDVRVTKLWSGSGAIEIQPLV